MPHDGVGIPQDISAVDGFRQKTRIAATCRSDLPKLPNLCYQDLGHVDAGSLRRSAEVLDVGVVPSQCADDAVIPLLWVDDPQRDRRVLEATASQGEGGVRVQRGATNSQGCQGVEVVQRRAHRGARDI
jgi:hypothetical protein